jgi:tripartite-type tricarboxylate transporter receptor subunit TctC
VTTKERSKSLPNVPTMAEERVTNYESYAWFGIAAPKGTPAPILERLNAELVKTIADPGVQARLIEIGVEPAATTRDEFKRFISSEIVKWRDIIQTAGIKAD